MATYYDKLLKLCGFKEEEIHNERPRIEKTFQRLELGPEDMKTAEEWVRQNHETELMGVRKLLRAWILELVDLVLAKDEGKKVFYYGFPSISGPGMAVAAASENVHSSCPDVIICITMGQIFNKLTPILDAGEENGLPPGHGLCSLQQIRVGALARGIIPIPDIVFTSGYYCDMGSKTDELLHERYGHPAVYVDGSMDSKWGEYPNYLPQRVEFLGAKLNKLFHAVKEVLGVEITSNAFNEATNVSRHLYRSIGQLARLMKADPMPISQAEIGLANYLPSGCTGRAMTEGPEAIATLIQEIKERIDQGIGVMEKAVPRVMLFTPPFSDARIIHMIEGAGLALAATFASAPVPRRTEKTTYITPGEIIAEREMRVALYHSTHGLAKRWIQAVEELDIDGSIWGYQFNCRPLALTSHCFPKYVQEQSGVPCLSLEMDYYDTRSYSAAALRTRVETFAEVLRSRKAARESS